MINTPLTLPCGATIKNRIAKSAMSENMGNKNHKPTSDFATLYSRWARGGAGLVITGNIMIDQNALGELNNVVVSKENPCDEELREWARHGSLNQTELWAQINHPGKQSPKFICPNPVAPSAIGYESELKAIFNRPRELSEAEILDLISRFAFAAKQVQSCGFTGVQIHGAHGYLVAQFLSPLHNQRQDKWGGTLENRMRFLVEVYREIRKNVGPRFPIGVKLNSADFQKGGFSEDESLEVVRKLDELGIDLIEVSGGTYESTAMMGSKKKSTQEREAYFQEYCSRIKSEVNAPILLTGGFRSPSSMTTALESRDCQMVGLARSLAIDPDFPKKIIEGKNTKSQVRPLSTGLKALDKMMALEITWYTQQLKRMGKGKEPRPHASTKLSVLKTILEFGLDSLKRVRA